MRLQINCPNSCCYHKPKFAFDVKLPQGCGYPKCERAGQVEVLINGLTFWMCLVHASGYEVKK
jgi:hypothetical protein